MNRNIYSFFVILFISVSLLIIGIFLTRTFIILKNNTNSKEKSFLDSDSVQLQNSESSAIMQAVIAKVNDNEKNMIVVDEKNTSEYYIVNYKFDEKSEFKPNQVVEIVYDGTILTTEPKKINNIKEINILNENSNILIPETVLRYCYSSEENVDIDIDEFNRNKIIFTITDNNEIKYEHINNYKIYKEILNPNYTGIESNTEATSTSTSTYTGAGFEYSYEEIDEQYNIDKIDTIKRDVIDSFKEKVEINFSKIYNLDNGNYYLILINSDFNYRIDFQINDDKLTYNEPYINK